MHKTFEFKTKSDLNVNNKDIEVITVETVSKKVKHFNQYTVSTIMQ